jgi:hypothetical protein
MEDVNKNNSVIIFNTVLNNKAQITADKIIARIKEGDISPAYLSIVLKKFEKVHELVTKDKDAKELIVNDIRKYLEGTKKTVELFGAKITVADAGYWDYSNTDDEYLKTLEKIHEETKELIKLRKKEIELLAIQYEKTNSPHNIHNLGLGIKSFTLKYDRLPRLEWDETIEVFDTNPPIKKGGEQLRYSL